VFVKSLQNKGAELEIEDSRSINLGTKNKKKNKEGFERRKLMKLERISPYEKAEFDKEQLKRPKSYWKDWSPADVVISEMIRCEMEQ
jgi:hypothetical protein